MPDIINLLPDAIANQIAAGEVIQRPASAVKELMENAIDAGSQSIKLVIKDAGKVLIQVIDDGCGMSETDARMCFERHATSKIKNIDDLFAIRTMGFRGEAMASIAAVAQVELKSRRAEDELGTHIIIEGSEVKSQEPCQCTAGTSISIKNLFYNVPARRNFLKSNPVETRHIIDEFQRIALAHPEIFFSLHHNGVEVFHLIKGKLRQRITGLFGKNYNERLVPVDESTDIINILGYVGKPEAAKKTRGDQFIFVNKRFIKNVYLNHAVANAYEELITKDMYPFFVLFLDIDPGHIDINVHPTKQEIKFDEEKIVYTFVRAGVKHSLAQYSVTPSLDFEQEDHLNSIESFANAFSNNSVTNNPERARTGLNPSFTPFREAFGEKGKPIAQNWEKLYDIAKQDLGNESQTLTIESKWHGEPLPGEQQETEVGKPFQLHNQYIIFQIKSGMMVVDQQAAHERILYERFIRAMAQNKSMSQQQLFPQTIELTVADAGLLEEILDDVRAFGFDIQPFGKNTFVVHGVPADLDGGNEQQVIEGLLENYKQNLSVLKMNKRDSLARSLAQNASIKTGKKLSDREMQLLIDELFACEKPYTTPGGRLTFLTTELSELAKKFENK